MIHAPGHGGSRGVGALAGDVGAHGMDGDDPAAIPVTLQEPLRPGQDAARIVACADQRDRGGREERGGKSRPACAFLS